MANLVPTALGPAPEYRRSVEERPVMLWAADVVGWWRHVNTRWIKYTGLVGEASGEHHNTKYRLRDIQRQYRWFTVRGRKRVAPSADGVVRVSSCTDIDEQAAIEAQRTAGFWQIVAVG